MMTSSIAMFQKRSSSSSMTRSSRTISTRISKGNWQTNHLPTTLLFMEMNDKKKEQLEQYLLGVFYANEFNQKMGRTT